MDDIIKKSLAGLKERIGHPPYPLRRPCVKCGEDRGRLNPSGGQDCVYCLNGHFQYNAPRTETGKERRSLQTIRHTPPSQRYRLYERAHGRCELCGGDGPLTVDHVLPERAGFDFVTGSMLESDDNKMALCAECNSGKSHRTPAPWLIAALLYRRTK